MMRISAGIGCALLFTAVVQASPHVVGYERFHADAPSAEGGAILFSELGCANCHGGSATVVPRQGSRLIDLSQRVERNWLIQFLKDPNSGREGSNMPRMFHGLGDEEIDAVVAYLGSIGKGIKFPTERHANAERGSALYHEKGCIACHNPTSDFRSPFGSGDELASDLAIAHPDLKVKTSLEALNQFLSSPSSYRPDGRMPHIVLDRQESLDIAAHLIDFQGSDPRELGSVKAWPKGDEGLIADGKALVTKLNCAACHELPGIEAAPHKVLASAPEKKEGNCLSSTPSEGVPHYDLTEAQRDSLNLFLAGDRTTEDLDGRLTLSAMNCYACHHREGIGGPTNNTDPFFHGDEGLGDSGRLPPPLTGIGDKLTADWMKSVFAGAEGSRVRPYLKTRMPNYPAQAEMLTNWLKKIDTPAEVTTIEIRPDDVESGRKLLGIHGGTNCITCHNWGEQKSLGIQALDISNLDERLEPGWFHDYLINPAEYRPGTLMPPLWPGGQSMVPDVLEGDTDRQIAAIWGFIKDGQGAPEGFPDRAGGQFELVPQDRPIIQRTFFEGTGSKAILVGFPGEIHLAYDGSSAQPSQVWHGQFFDAYDTWFTRAAPFENPLSEEVYVFGRAEGERRFLGYRLDEAGYPTFLSKEGGRSLEEVFRVEGKTLVRTIRWDEGEAPSVAHLSGAEVAVEETEKTLTLIYSWR